MKWLVIEIDKGRVLREVARTASYVGIKSGKEGAYERMFTVDEDEPLLNGYFEECRAVAADTLKRVTAEEGEESGVWRLCLKLPWEFHTGLKNSLNESIFTYFVAGICAKWFEITDKESAEGYTARAASALEEVRRLVFYKRPPLRPGYHADGTPRHRHPMGDICCLEKTLQELREMCDTERLTQEIVEKLKETLIQELKESLTEEMKETLKSEIEAEMKETLKSEIEAEMKEMFVEDDKRGDVALWTGTKSEYTGVEGKADETVYIIKKE